MIFSIAPTNQQLKLIKESRLYHRSPAKYRDQIIMSGSDVLEGTLANIHLQAQTGWTLSLWRLIRDLTVIDFSLLPDGKNGKYLYFFVGAPSKAQQVANAGETYKATGVDRYEILGSDLTRFCDQLFYRPIDKVLIVRGDYKGPVRLVSDT
jgi:hypothetical protein